MTMITPSYLGETIEYSSLHACRSTLEDPTKVASQPLCGARTDDLDNRSPRSVSTTNCARGISRRHPWHASIICRVSGTSRRYRFLRMTPEPPLRSRCPISCLQWGHRSTGYIPDTRATAPVSCRVVAVPLVRVIVSDLTISFFVSSIGKFLASSTPAFWGAATNALHLTHVHIGVGVAQ